MRATLTDMWTDLPWLQRAINRLLTDYLEHQIKAGELERVCPQTLQPAKPHTFIEFSGKVEISQNLSVEFRVWDENVGHPDYCWVVLSLSEGMIWLSNGFNRLGSMRPLNLGGG